MSSETKWTKGEWRNLEGFNCYVETVDGLPIAVTHPHKIAGPAADDGVDCPTLDECLANGVLIAASPKLYEALSALTDWAAWSYPQTETYAEEFARETGMLAPFKDMGAVADEAEELRAVRTEEWRAWLSRKRAALIAAARTALASARGEG